MAPFSGIIDDNRQQRQTQDQETTLYGTTDFHLVAGAPALPALLKVEQSVLRELPMAAFERCDVATWTHVKGGYGQEAPVGLNRVKVGNVWHTGRWCWLQRMAALRLSRRNVLGAAIGPLPSTITVKNGPFLACNARDVIPTTSNLRRYLSPIFVIFPSFSLPPLDLLSGVKPSQAARSRPVLNWCPSPIVATMADAVIGPTPGIRVRRRQSASSKAC